MSNPHNLQVGQKLYFVHADPRRGTEGEEMTVTKIGRKWADTAHARGYAWHKINMETLSADGGQYSPPGRAYLSKTDHEEETRLQDAWRVFQGLVPYQVPAGMTLDRIKELIVEFGIKLRK